MESILDKINEYFDETEDEKHEESSDILDEMYNLITSLDPDKLSDEQADLFVEIIDNLADETNEAVAAKKVKINPADKRKRRQQYRKNKAKIKVKAKRYRKTASFKKWKKKSDRKKSAGKTATGKRIRKFL